MKNSKMTFKQMMFLIILPFLLLYALINSEIQYKLMRFDTNLGIAYFIVDAIVTFWFTFGVAMLLDVRKPKDIVFILIGIIIIILVCVYFVHGSIF